MVFEQGKRYRFSAKRHKKDMGEHWTWPDEHDGEEVMPVDDTWASTPTLITTVHRDWCEEVEEKKMPTRSIHISTDADGKTIHAVMKQGDKVVRREKAVCAPSDAYDFEAGATVAFDRLFAHSQPLDFSAVDASAKNATWGKPDDKPKEDKPAYREVKRKAEVGEWVKIVSCCSLDVYKIADVLRVISTHENSNGVYVSTETQSTYYGDGTIEQPFAYVMHSEYAVLEGYDPAIHGKPAMEEKQEKKITFRVFDKVLYCGASIPFNCEPGQVFTVTNVPNTDGYYCVMKGNVKMWINEKDLKPYEG